jgi:hypothetical protein
MGETKNIRKMFLRMESGGGVEIMKLSIERSNGIHRVIETKKFDTDIYPAAIGLAIRYCHDMGWEAIDIRNLEESKQ